MGYGSVGETLQLATTAAQAALNGGEPHEARARAVAAALVLLADGLGAAQIGAQLYMSESTAKSHIARIYQKLGAANRTEAVARAREVGLIR